MWRVVGRRLLIAFLIFAAAAIVAGIILVVAVSWFFGPIGPDD
jgi:hypothetical protein